MSQTYKLSLFHFFWKEQALVYEFKDINQLLCQLADKNNSLTADILGSTFRRLEVVSNVEKEIINDIGKKLNSGSGSDSNKVFYEILIDSHDEYDDINVIKELSPKMTCTDLESSVSWGDLGKEKLIISIFTWNLEKSGQKQDDSQKLMHRRMFENN
jgi:hypothetical protein